MGRHKESLASWAERRRREQVEAARKVLTRDPVMQALGELTGLGWVVWADQGVVRLFMPGGVEKHLWLDIDMVLRRGYFILPNVSRAVAEQLSGYMITADSSIRWLGSWPEVAALRRDPGDVTWGHFRNDTEMLLTEIEKN